MKIVEFAGRAGVNIQTVRYYERRNILQPSDVTSAGYRIYGEQDLKKLRFIKQTQGLGFSLKEIKEFLQLSSKSQSSCRSVLVKAKSRLKFVREKIQSLQRIESALTELVDYCDKNSGSNRCTLLDGLES